MRNPTLHDVARAAGVSYSTADRVLNERGGVAEKSVLRVRHAIEKLGYRRDIHAANLSRRRSYAFRFYLPHGDHSFFSILRQTVEQQARQRLADRIAIAIHEVPALDAEALADQLLLIGRQDCDCVAFVGADSARLTQAVSRLAGMGIPAISLISDAAGDARAQYVGIDNRVAGRTAGRLIRLAHSRRSGRILPILGKLGVRDHRDRLDGAREVLAETPALQVLAPLEILDRPERMRDSLTAALHADPGVTGIYSIGAGNRALIDILGRLAAPRPFAVLHELTPQTRPALESGLIDAIIDQKPAEEIRSAIDAMKAIADRQTPPATDITPTIYLKDNLPGPAGNGGPA
ncbi:LacI family transcriptional regulator [Paracoccus halophilus]|uniref:LacI family transcriptional regulator n=1 Tax=Paracoccus halophilus TaxID=376733 RepID=A0A099F5V9_9RHOB|nr:LacI family DNA-binding transcriptional regulator [Paracoccus halophilus]KGJ05601.1 LacI family transcriptional regulator [Paracoccus halophilus]SFA47325.1 LacI family transcriptional regulator [Paracoccus halophilus]